MLKVNSLKKTYYKGKSNEIKVINNTTFELPDTGLISFLGQSGSGKTTLLNTLGGLDSPNSGSISYGETTFSKYKMDKMDNFRRKNIGYVFQNYLLIEEMSVYDNLRLALEIIDITDEEEVKKRIEYALKAVGLYKYRKKLASALSGGQQQRVSIARALVKKCRIIIADEPTGNLDSENSIEIMNILKKISRDSLVLLVTHSAELANFYSDRIIEIKDGSVIKDDVNVSSGSLDRKNDKVIHLLDYEKKEISEDKLLVDLYSNENSKNQKISIIIRDNVIYVDSESPLQIVSSSSVKIVNDHYQEINVKNVDEFDYDNSWFEDKKDKAGVKNFFKKLGQSFRIMSYSTRKKRFFNSIFVILGVLMGILVTVISTYSPSSYVDDGFSDYYVVYKKSENAYSRAILSKTDYAKFVNEGKITDFKVAHNKYYNFYLNSVKQVDCNNISSYLFPFSEIENEKIIYGRKPEGENEVVIGKALADYFISSEKYLSEYSQLINGTYDNDFSIVGISSCDTNAVYYKQIGYVNEGLYVDAGSLLYYPYYDYIELSEGTAPLNNLEVVISEQIQDEYSLEIGSEIDYPDGKVKVTGIIDSSKTSNLILTSDINLLKYSLSDEGKLDSPNYKVSSANINKYYATEAKDVHYLLVKGNEPSSKYEVLASVYSNFNVGDKFYDEAYTVSGLFIPLDDDYEYLYTYDILASVDRDMVKLKYMVLCYDGFFDTAKTLDKYNSEYFSNYKIGFKITSKETISELENLGYTVIESNKFYKAENSKDSETTNNTFMVIELVLCAVIVIYTFFSERAKIISDVYSIGVMRSLGISRSRLIQKQLRDNFAKTTLTTFIGYLIVIVCYVGFNLSLANLGSSTNVGIRWLNIFGGAIILYVLEMIISIIPLLFLLRKTPSEINSKYDI